MTSPYSLLRVMIPAVCALGACQSPDVMTIDAEPPAAASMDQMMERMIYLGTPAEEHALLEQLIGTFDTQLSMWASPGAEVVELTGVMVNSWILGGCFLRSDYESEWMGQPFIGLGLMGYDKNIGAYVGTWCDSSSTMLAPVAPGTLSEDGTRIVTHKEMIDPMTGAQVHVRDVLIFQGPDKHCMEMYHQPEGESEFLMMRLNYTRSAGSSQ